MATVFVQKRIGKTRTSYQVLYYDPVSGRKKHYKTYRKKREADQAGHELRAMLDNGKLPEAHKKRFNPMAFNEVSASMKSVWDKRLEEGSLAQATHGDYLRYIKQLNSHFGKALLCSITSADILAYREARAKAYSNITANRMLFVLKQVMKHALELRSIQHDPAAEIKYLSERAHQRNRFLLPKQLEVLLTCARKTGAKNYLPAIILLAAEHGASRQECLSLEWTDIHFDFEGVGLIRFLRTKNGCERTMYLMPRTREALLHWRRHLKSAGKSRIAGKKGPVFTQLNATPLKCFKRGFWAACKLAGLEGFHFHDLRHTYCSNLVISGSGLKEAKDMIGHSDIKMTDRYSHLSALHQKNVQQRLSDHYTGGMGGEDVW